MKLIVASIPLFFILIAVELVAARILDRRVYRFADTFIDLGCGMIEQLLSVLVKASLFATYLTLYARFRIFDLREDSGTMFAACFIATDFLYYWFHRLSHETGAMWAAHSVHHQSEEYNLSVALRQGAFQSFFSWVFYLPLAVFGFAPATFITCSALNTLYQFWIHTRLIGRLGPFEWIFNTPSHHRVHHGRNPRYIDRNHAGVFIVWDRLFGTFVPETDEPVYGVVKPLASFNPLWANVAGWAELVQVARRSAGIMGRLRPFLAPPGYRPSELGGPLKPKEVSRPADEPADHPIPKTLAAYVLINFIFLLILTAAALTRASDLGTKTFLTVAVSVAFGLASLSALLEGRSWAPKAEGARILLLVLALALALAGEGLGAPFPRLFFPNP
jgi:sterol desaturase/sphingolipid hydroxylase (fatty acid hydroxylase superfamily)